MCTCPPNQHTNACLDSLRRECAQIAEQVRQLSESVTVDSAACKAALTIKERIESGLGPFSLREVRLASNIHSAHLNKDFRMFG